MAHRRASHVTSRWALRLLVALALVGFALGCASPGEEATPTQAPEEAVETDVSKKGPVTLVVWAYAQEDDTLERLTRQFEQKYPNVSIELVATKGFNDYYTTLKLGLSGGNAPDVAVGNQGWTADGPLIKAGLIAPLDAYAKAYGWLDRGYGSLDELRFTPDGSEWGTGSLFGMAHWAAPVGFFYSRDKLEKLGLDVPTSFDELENALETAKGAGEIPIQFGNLDKWPGTQEYAMVQNFLAPADETKQWIYGREGSSFVTPENVEAALILQDWAKKGYFTPGFNGVSYDDATAKFADGEGAFLFSGAWLTGAYEGKNIGFTLLPPAEGGDPVAIGSLGEPWHITSKSESKDVAAAYIDFITGEEAASEFLKVGFIPAIPLEDAEATGLFAETLDAWNRLNEGGGLVNYLEWSSPTMGEAMGGGVQLLMAGRITPEEFVERVQADWSKFQQSR